MSQEEKIRRLEGECSAYYLLHKEVITEYQRAMLATNDPGVVDAAKCMRIEIERMRAILRQITYFGVALITRDYEPGSPMVRELVEAAREIICTPTAMSLVNLVGRTPRNGDHVWHDKTANTWIVTDLPSRDFAPPENHPNAIWQGRLRDDNFADVHVLVWREKKAKRFTPFPSDEEDEDFAAAATYSVGSDPDDEEYDLECGYVPGLETCTKAGSEECDFECPRNRK